MSLKLNYHHLRYFREVAQEGHLSQAAARLNVAQSALSLQIKQLEDRLGHPLFDRVGRKLVLTEAGRIALDHADRIFSSGDELLASLETAGAARLPLRVGALSTLSRNFQLQFLRPLMAEGRHGVTLKSGNMRTLLADLEALTLDVILTTDVPQAQGFAAQRIATQPVSLHGRPDMMQHDTLIDLLEHAPLILPSESIIRAGFDNLIARLGVEPKVAAHVDDMAMVRLLAREGFGVAVAPAVVVADEVTAGLLATAPFDLGIEEPFFAVTLPRKFPHPALADLLNAQLV
ncbi:MAG: LysR family transcriptional regulator [Pseudomonadota bacterium]